MVLTIPHVIMLKNIIYKYSCYCVQYATQYILYILLLYIWVIQYIHVYIYIYVATYYYITFCSSCAFYILHFLNIFSTFCQHCVLVRRYCNANVHDIQCTMVLLHKKTSKISCSNFVTSLTIITNT